MCCPASSVVLSTEDRSGPSGPGAGTRIMGPSCQSNLGVMSMPPPYRYFNMRTIWILIMHELKRPIIYPYSVNVIDRVSQVKGSMCGNSGRF